MFSNNIGNCDFLESEFIGNPFIEEKKEVIEDMKDENGLSIPKSPPIPIKEKKEVEEHEVGICLRTGLERLTLDDIYPEGYNRKKYYPGQRLLKKLDKQLSENNKNLII
jgi:hypothetical protein